MKTAKFHPALKSILRGFPEDIRREVGKAIFELQKGETTQATPKREIDLGKRRLREML